MAQENTTSSVGGVATTPVGGWRENLPPLLGPTKVPLAAPAVMLCIIVVVMLFAAPTFFSVGNLRAIAMDASLFMLLGVGMTAVITSRGIDLSIGAILILSSVAFAAALKDFGLPLFLALFIGLAVGALCGLVNGLLVTKLKMPDFIVTLSTELVFRGLALVYAGGGVFFGFPEAIRFFGRGRIGEVPIPLIVALAVVVIAHLIFAYHRVGVRLHAVGANPLGAKRLGVNVQNYRIGVYVFMGLIAAIGGIMLAGRLDAVVASGAVTILLNTIAAVIVGGTYLFGGRGSVVGTFLGAWLLAAITNAVVMLGFEAFWQNVAAGAVILITIGLYSHRSGRSEE
ncbi:ABC transporter permease [Gymnodinialimonas ceratoperidinii]|uniref:ABC transporter permease n=1 Tax=Gymnodinialimonas ceratoperidinii TaxID=2856823 RepID=A0A8F6TW80_9RHOB|nr:ABC transporter permease [Gymnodinialimonas ceratoperidinii]QXT39063.1 ABC transporter permease [Gymnodinialimonas ceratoperidinii]